MATIRLSSPDSRHGFLRHQTLRRKPVLPSLSLVLCTRVYIGKDSYGIGESPVSFDKDWKAACVYSR